MLNWFGLAAKNPLIEWILPTKRWFSRYLTKWPEFQYWNMRSSTKILTNTLQPLKSTNRRIKHTACCILFLQSVYCSIPYSPISVRELNIQAWAVLSEHIVTACRQSSVDFSKVWKIMHGNLWIIVIIKLKKFKVHTIGGNAVILFMELVYEF